jgi:ankyrin repeat protein
VQEIGTREITSARIDLQLRELSADIAKIYINTKAIKNASQTYTLKDQAGSDDRPTQSLGIGEVINNMERLVQHTETYAGSIMGDSEYGSIFGFPLADGKRGHVESWLSQAPAGYDEDESSSNASTLGRNHRGQRETSPSRTTEGTSTSMPSHYLTVSEQEDVAESQLIGTFAESIRSFVKRKDHKAAEWHLQALLLRTSQRLKAGSIGSISTIDAVRSILALHATNQAIEASDGFNEIVINLEFFLENSVDAETNHRCLSARLLLGLVQFARKAFTKAEAHFEWVLKITFRNGRNPDSLFYESAHWFRSTLKAVGKESEAIATTDSYFPAPEAWFIRRIDMIEGLCVEKLAPEATSLAVSVVQSLSDMRQVQPMKSFRRTVLRPGQHLCNHEMALAAFNSQCPNCLDRRKRAKGWEQGLSRDSFQELMAGGFHSAVLGFGRGCSMLHIIAVLGYANLLHLLIARTANPEAETLGGYTPLVLAAIMGHVEVSKLLLARGAWIESCGKDGFTPLLQAVKRGHFEMADHLLQNGANLEAKGVERKRTAVEIFFGQPRPQEGTALLLASSSGNLKITRLLLDNGAKIESRIRDGHTPLSVASASGRTEIVRLLLDRNADVNAIGASGGTPLYHAAKQGNLEIVRLLLRRDAHLEAGRPWTPLLGAARSGQTEVVALLLESGAKIEAKVNNRTAWDLAKDGGHKETVNLLKAYRTKAKKRNSSTMHP